MRDEAASVNAQNTSARASLPRSLLLAWINGFYAKYLCREVRVETSQDDQRFRLRCNGARVGGFINPNLPTAGKRERGELAPSLLVDLGYLNIPRPQFH